MIICLAQTRSVKGDIEANIQNHKRLIDLATSHRAELIVFPELSITGYEPSLAKDLATDANDRRFDVFQEISHEKGITICVGIPTIAKEGNCISMIIFQPDQPRMVYSKKYLHADEEPFFVSGENFPVLRLDNTNVSFAICYELSIPAHAELAVKSGGEVYIASVAKTKNGVENAHLSLSGIAVKYEIPVLMVNCLGECDGVVCTGSSAVWDDQGEMLGQLDDVNEGILIFDTESGEVWKG